MAGVLTGRTLTRNIFKFHDAVRIAKRSRSTSVFFISLNPPQGSSFRQHRHLQNPLQPIATTQIRCYGSAKPQAKDEEKDKPSLFQRFKRMYQDYWYVLVPVHLITSAAWFGGFYYLAKSGVDISAFLESLSISGKITNQLKDSNMGYLAVAYALYKVATPARYTVTLAGTTVSINYLKKWGYIKPVPSKERLKEIYLEKKENLIEDLDKSIKHLKDLGGKITTQDNVNEAKKKVEKCKKKD